MAMTINSSPELLGNSAIDFIAEADRNSQNPAPRLSEERELEISEFLRKSRDFIFPPKDKK